MARPAQVTSDLLFKLAPWDALDSAYEKLIPFDSPAEWADTLRRQCEAGSAQCFHLETAGRRVGLFVVKVDEGARRELVLVAAYAAARFSVARLLGMFGDQLARSLRCCCIRFHTVRPGLARIAADEFGYRLSEIVLRKNVLLQV